MNEQNLPQGYKGYSTAELLALWRKIPSRKYGDPASPREKVSAMRDLLKEHRLAPVHWGFVKEKPGHTPEQEKADMIHSKKLLAPFGIDPAPWADQEGNRLRKAGRTASS
jgi:hypothetical protein